MIDINAFAGGDKPHPCARSSAYEVAAGFIPAHFGRRIIAYR